MPKPLHGWRELAGEVVIIVIGVLIALGAEQVVETLHWRERASSANQSIEHELNEQLDYSEEAVGLHSCMKPYVDSLEHAIIGHDAADIQRLEMGQAPFRMRPWRSTAWQSAMSTQVADHIEIGQMSEFAIMFTSFDEIHSLQNSAMTNAAEAMAGRLNGPFDPASVNLQLAAAERLRSELSLEYLIARTMIQMEAGNNNLHRILIQRRRKRSFQTLIIREANNCARTVGSLASSNKVESKASSLLSKTQRQPMQ